jgi:hypothetical protein
VSEQQAEPSSGETGSLGAGPAVPPSSDASSEPKAASASETIESPDLAPGQGDAPKADAPKADAPKADAPKADAPKADAPKADAPKADAPKADAPKADAPKADAPKADAPKADAPKAEAPELDAAKADAPRAPGKLMIMSAADHAGDHENTDPQVESGQADGTPGKRRLSAMAAVAVLAAVAGALGGALATAGLGHFAGADKAASNNLVLEASVARIDADLLALKASVEHTSKLGISQFNKTSDRLDKVEKAQAEPAARLAKLSDAVDKLRAAPAAVATAPVAAKEVTGSISPPATAVVAAPVPLPAPRPELARLPTVEGWVLRDVANGVALIEGRQGIFEVYAGDPVPGLGRVDAIRKQDGRWVVVTSKGLVIAR